MYKKVASSPVAPPSPIQAKYLEPSHDLIDTTDVGENVGMNENSIYITIGALNKAQVHHLVGLMVDKCSLALNGEKCKYRVQVPTNKTGKTFGHAYAWFTNTKFYYTILGYNPDGSERITHTVVQPSLTSSSGSSALSSSVADLTDWDAPVEAPPVVEKVVLPPLVGRFEVTYDAEARVRAREIEAFYRKVTVDMIKDEDVPTTFMPQFGPSIAYEVSDAKVLNQLYAYRVPMWVTPKMVCDAFSPYAVNSGNKVSVSETHGKGSKTIYITFAEQKWDAVFALQMTKRFTFESSIKGKKMTHECIFDHPESTD
jgi:hypothetical protein